jgi:predicted GNAT family acetyltransferase
MKTNKLFITLFFLAAFSIKMIAQECQGYFPFEPGTEIEMTYYDKKGKVTMVTQTKIKDLLEEGGTTQALVYSKTLDKKDKLISEVDFEVICSEDGYEIDFTNLVNPMLLQSANGMEMKIEGDALVFPNDLSDGKVLENASSEIKVYSNDIKLMTMNFEISNRKVEGKETITTSAGTFECYKLSYDFDTKLAFAKKNYHVEQWIAENVGIVKEQTYNKKDKMESYSELTKFTQ